MRPSSDRIVSYRKTDFPWLDQIPAHWNVKRFKYILKECDERSIDGLEPLLRVSQYTGITQRKNEENDLVFNSRAQSLVGYKIVHPENMVINIMLAWNGSVGVSPFHGIVSPAYCVYKFSNGYSPRYYHYLLRSNIYKARIKGLSTGVIESRLRLYTDDLFRLEALVPPLEEQSAIVRYLDHMDNLIKRYIRAN